MTHLCDLIPGERSGERKRRLAQAAQQQAKRDAGLDYNRQIAERERIERQKVPLNNATTRRTHAEATVARLERDLLAIERQAVDDHNVIKRIRPAREDLEIAREILARTVAAEGAERTRYEALIAENDAPAPSKRASK